MTDLDEVSDDDEPPMLVGVPPPMSSSTAGTEASLAASHDARVGETSQPIVPPCPVTILSGFLGSGKTTLIQYILKDPNHGKRIAVIENEFGEGLAVESLIARDGVSEEANNSLQDLIELPNGCICCTVKDSLVTTLENLVNKRQDLDYILIEASGMANPGPIASVFWLDDALESRLQLDGIVTLVDSHNILQQLESTEEAAQQVAYADRLLINKVDLLRSDVELQAVVAALRKLHPTAPFQTTTFSKVPDLDWILNANCFGGVARVVELDTIWNHAAAICSSQQATEHHHSHDHGECATCQEAIDGHHMHTDAVSTLAFRRVGSVDLTKLNKWLAEILWPNQDETNKILTTILHDSKENELFVKKKAVDQNMQLFRIKGIVSALRSAPQEKTELHHSNAYGEEGYRDPIQPDLDRRRFIVQAVHDLWDVHPASDDLQWSEGEEREARLVVIGKFLNKEHLERGFQSCFVECSDAIATSTH